MNTPSLSFEEWNAQAEHHAVPTVDEIAARAKEDPAFRVALFAALAAELDHILVLEGLLPGLLDDGPYVYKAVSIATEIDSDIAVDAIVDCHAHNSDHPLVKRLADESTIVEWIAEEYTVDDWIKMHSEGDSVQCNHDMDSIINYAESAIDSLNDLIVRARDDD